MTEIAVALTGIKKHFGDVRAVDGIDLTVNSGEIVALLGPNGAGKTTTLDMLLGLTSPDSGSVEVFGGDPIPSIRAGRLSALLQTGGLLQDMKVHEILDYIASTFKGLDLDTKAVMQKAGITNIAKRYVKQCSGGEQQRLKFALAILTDPDVLVLDEPTTGLDVAARRTFWETMNEEAMDGRTVIFATHYLEEAEQYASRIVLMNKGRIVADGTVSEVRAFTGMRHLSIDTKDVAHAGVLGSSVRNQFENSHVEVIGKTVHVRSIDSDEIARFLLAEPGVKNLEIAAPSLDDAFIELTNGN